MGLLINRTGERYGFLTVLGRDTSVGPASKGARVMWLCKCDCGIEVRRSGHELASGDTRSCGCFRRNRTSLIRRTHGMTRSPTYRSWQAMKERCSNPNNVHYPRYGARGVAVCPEWESSFEAFINSMGERPDGMTLDRIDPEGNYTPENCRWANSVTQGNNKASNVTWNGKRISIKQLASEIGVPRTSLNKLLKKGMPVDEAVSHSLRRRK